MSTEIKVPEVGESIRQGQLVEWLQRDGATVAADVPLFELETDKVSLTVNAPAAGRLVIAVPAVATVEVGQVVGRIEALELLAAPPAALPAASRPIEAPAEAIGPGSAPPQRETRRSMSALRRAVAERLVLARQSAAILTTFNEVDLSAAQAWRERHGEAFQQRHGVRLGLMSFFVKAVVEALRAVPALNARIEGDEIVDQHYFDIGVAVGTEQGLVVPVIRDADRLPFAAIEQTLAALARRARERTLTLAELTGGCFTISNGGVYGSLLSTPLLNPPQSGILGMHAIKRRPVAVGERVEIRPMMYLAVSYDHRLVDGRDAVTFLDRIVKHVEQPERLVLGA